MEKRKTAMFKTYQKSADYSYTEGMFPTFELVKKHPEAVLALYVDPDSASSEGALKLKELVSPSQFIVSGKSVARLSSKGNAHVIGVFKKYEEKLDPSAPHVVLVNPSDMGNLGNIMRSMLAFSYKDLAIVLPAADRFAPHVVRSSMGAFFSIRQETFESFDEYLAKYPRPYYPFMLNPSATPLSKVELPKDSSFALVFGNEATGLPKELGNGNTVFIEQSKDVDSLNLATSVVLALYRFRINR